MRQRKNIKALSKECSADEANLLDSSTDVINQSSTEGIEAILELDSNAETDVEIENDVSYGSLGPSLGQSNIVQSDPEALVTGLETPAAIIVAEDLVFNPIYTPLAPIIPGETSSHKIRLLLISPKCDSHHGLRGSLTVFSLSNAPSFIAVSYEWEGLWTAPDIDTSIRIDEYDLSLKPNLARALRSFQQHFDEPTYLWVDSICINQADVRERGHQVQLMKDIYRSAAGVWVWLGPTSHNSDLAMDVIDEVANFPEDMKGEYSRSIKWVKRVLYDPAYAAHRLALCALFRRSYWKRLWIVQEVVLGACTDRPKVCCGNRISALGQIMKLAKGIRVVLNSSKTSQDWRGLTLQKLEMAIKTLTDLGDHIEEYSSESQGTLSSDLLGLLKRYSGKQCSEPKDKIYALSGLMDPENAILLVDYSLTLEEVCRQATCHIIEFSGNLETLSLCSNTSKAFNGVRNTKDDESSMLYGPSWVPNWSQDIGIRLWPTTIVDQVPNVSNSGYESCPSIICGEVLETAAMMCGRIIEVIPIWRAGTPFSEKDHLQRVLQVLHRLLLSFEEKLTFEPSDTMLKARATADLLYRILFTLGSLRQRKHEESTEPVEHPHINRDAFITWASEFLSGRASSIEYPASLRDFVKQPKRTLFIYRVSASKSSTPASHSFGLSLAKVQPDDEIVIIPTCKCTMLLRRSNGASFNNIDQAASSDLFMSPSYEVVGPCYISNPNSFDLEVFVPEVSVPRKRANLRYIWKKVMLV